VSEALLGEGLPGLRRDKEIEKLNSRQFWLKGKIVYFLTSGNLRLINLCPKKLR